MESAIFWQQLFQSWPEGFARQGILMTTQPDTIPFTDFMLHDGLLLLDRDKPDSQGARKVILSYEAIASVKFTSTIPMSDFEPLGFRPVSS